MSTVVTRRTAAWLIMRCPECNGRWPIARLESQDPRSKHHLCPSCERPGIPSKKGWQ